jgi:glutaredoxin
MEEILVYGASWCPDCRREQKFLADQRVSYGWHDIESEPDLESREIEEGHPPAGIRLHRARPEHRLPQEDRGPGRAGLRCDGSDLHELDARHLRRRRRRDGSRKQLASAVGDGAAAAIQIRGYLGRLEQGRTA